jgi:hypothetical protein
MRDILIDNETSATPDSFLIFDNNFLNVAYSKVGGDAVFSKLIEESTTKTVPDFRRQPAIITPFALLEAIGFGTIPSVNSFKPDKAKISLASKKAENANRLRVKVERDKSNLPGDEIAALTASAKLDESAVSELIKEIRLDLLQKYCAFFESNSQLQISALKAKYNERLPHLSPSGQAAYAKFFEPKLQDDEDVKYISQYLAYDALYKIDWPKVLRPFHDVHVFTDLFHSLNDDKGVMQTRALKYSWRSFTDQVIEMKLWPSFKMDEAEFRAEVRAALDALDLKTRKDLLDTEILQLLTTGKNLNGKLLPVFVYTNEDPLKFMNRLRLVTGFIRAIRETVIQYGSLPEFAPGTVVFVDTSGKIREILYVGSVTPFLADKPPLS